MTEMRKTSKITPSFQRPLPHLKIISNISRYHNRCLQDIIFCLAISCVLIWILPAFIAGCGKKEPAIAISEFEIEVNVTLDNQPLQGADVYLDDERVGQTDEHGYISKVSRLKPGTTVQVRVTRAIDGYQIEPWQKSFTVRPSHSEILDKYAFDVGLQAEKIISVLVTDSDGTPLADADVTINEEPEYSTDASGLFHYRFVSPDGDGLHFKVSKPGFTTWEKSILDIQPGQSIHVLLTRQSILTVGAFTDKYGLSLPLSGIEVWIDGRRVGWTDYSGIYRHKITGQQEADHKVALKAAGYRPSRWTSVYKSGNDANLRKHFRTGLNQPLKMMHIGYRNNAAGSTIGPELKRLHAAVTQNLYRNRIFKKVSNKKFNQAVQSAGLNMQKIIQTGWLATPLLDTVDMVIAGSVSRVDNQYLVITDVHRPDGKILISTMMRVTGVEQLNLAARGIARSLMDRFPFEGIITASRNGRFRLNMDRNEFNIRRGNVFYASVIEYDTEGNISGYRNSGKLRVVQADENGTWARVIGHSTPNVPKVGQRVMRQFNSDREDKQVSGLTLKVSRGRSKNHGPLDEVHVYLDDQWVGQTGADGKTRLDVLPGEKYNISLYKHGFKPLTIDFGPWDSRRSVAFALKKVSS